MSSVKLKEKIYKKLESIDDYLLEEILGLIELENTRDKLLKIPEEHKGDIEIGIAQIDAGQTVSNEVANQRVKKWLDK